MTPQSYGLHKAKYTYFESQGPTKLSSESMTYQTVDEEIQRGVENGHEMRNVDEGVEIITRVPSSAIDNIFNVAELVHVQKDTKGMTAKEDDDNAKQYHA